MNKRQATRKVNAHLNSVVLDNDNTIFSNINAAKPVWWINIPLEKFKKEINILLAKKKEGSLIWLKIKADTFLNPEKVFRIRNDKGAVDLEIACEGSRYMCDIKGRRRYNFRRHIECEWDK